MPPHTSNLSPGDRDTSIAKELDVLAWHSELWFIGRLSEGNETDSNGGRHPLSRSGEDRCPIPAPPAAHTLTEVCGDLRKSMLVCWSKVQPGHENFQELRGNVERSQGHALLCSESLVFGLVFMQGAFLLAPDIASLLPSISLGQAVTRPTVNPGCAHFGQG